MNRATSSTERSSRSSFFDRALRNIPLRRINSESEAECKAEAFGATGLNLLHTPASETIVDIVFVHGLKGGSRQAWSYSSHPSHFWPKAWLPFHPELKHARIHSYGYNCDWTVRGETPLSIHDFGQTLIEILYHSSELRKDTTTKIVLVAHSMGGLVVKKAIIASRQNPTFHDLGQRIYAVFFFGTPHRGSDLATKLDNYLKATFHTPKNYVRDLFPGSEAINVLNEEFRNAYEGIKLYSFFETMPMPWQFGAGLVVDRNSAILDWKGEHQIMIQADHRGMNKFAGPDDPEYLKVKECLSTVVQEIVQMAPDSKTHGYQNDLCTIAADLDILSDPEDYFSELEDERLEGSCGWLLENGDFQEWMSNGTSARYFWLRGPPATGKSMLASSVISELDPRSCSYFFFKQGDQQRSSVSRLLQSFAYQMAKNNIAIRKCLVNLAKESFQTPKDDYKAIWRRVFQNGIFTKWPQERQYWVIDALDECRVSASKVYEHLYSILSRIDDQLPLKILITSTPSRDIDQLMGRLPKFQVQISLDSTLQDIRRYVEANSNNLPDQGDHARNSLIRKVIEKSSGCFLWVSFVVDQLKECYSSEEIEEVLEEIPEALEDIYRRNIKTMISHVRSAKLAKTVLTWTLYAVRPLKVEELKSAIKLDTGQDVTRDLETSIAPLCGHLVQVDKHGNVQMVHQTARAFLTSSNLASDFHVSTAEGHLHLSLACLKYLCSDEMKHTKSQRASYATKSAIAPYACAAFSEHLARATSTSEPLFRLLTTFLRTNVLTWIEYMAQRRDLSTLVQTAKQFKTYLGRRAKHIAALEDDIRMWAKDLPRIVTEFGWNLLQFPTAIHDLIPPLCPRNSIIYTSFGRRLSGIKLLGLANTDWYDRIACALYKDNLARCVACRDQWYAVGVADGRIYLYDTSTCEELKFLDQGESVRLLEFGPGAKHLASAGLHYVTVWDVRTGMKVLEIKLDYTPFSMAFNELESTITIATGSLEISTWSLQSKERTSAHALDNVLKTEDPRKIGQVPAIIQLSTECGMIAVAYRSRPLLLFDLEAMQCLGACYSPGGGADDTSYYVTSVAFNPNPETKRLVVAYWDGTIALFDTRSLAMVQMAKELSQILAVSPDGRTLAGGSSSGKIQLFDFDTLDLLYSVTPSDDGVSSLTFTADSRRLIDTRAYQSNVWEPSVLVRNSPDDNHSEPSDTLVGALDALSMTAQERTINITSIVCCSGGNQAICGKSNGSVEIYDLTAEHKASWPLYKHASTSTEVSILDWNEDYRILASADVSGRFQVVRLREDPGSRGSIVNIVLDEQLEYSAAVQQLLLSGSGTRLLVSSDQVDHLWCLKTKRIIRSHRGLSRTKWKWFKHPSSPNQMILLQDDSISIYHWRDFEPISDRVLISSPSDQVAALDVDTAVLLRHDGNLVLRMLSDKGSVPSGEGDASRNVKNFRLYTIDLSMLKPGLGKIAPTPFFAEYQASNSPDVDLLIGTVISMIGGHMLVFMTESGWVCSLDLSFKVPHESFRRHFFVPFAWLSLSTRVLAKVTDTRDILFIHGDEIAVAQNGLDEVEVVSMRG